MNRQRQSLSTENSRASSGGGIPERFRRGSAEREERRLAKMLAGAHRARGGNRCLALGGSNRDELGEPHRLAALGPKASTAARYRVASRISVSESMCPSSFMAATSRTSLKIRSTPMHSGPRDLCAEARDPIASTHADAAELERRSWRREAIDRRRRGPEPCRPNGRDHSAVVPAARVAEEVDRDAEERRSSCREPATSLASWRAPMAVRSAWVRLCASISHPPAISLRTCRSLIPPRMYRFLTARLSTPGQPRSRSVGNAGARRFDIRRRMTRRPAGAEAMRGPPVIPDRAQRHRGVFVPREPSHLPGEIVVRDVELWKRRARGRISEHVVHEDRNRRRSWETSGLGSSSRRRRRSGRSGVASPGLCRSRSRGAGRARRERNAGCERRCDGRDREGCRRPAIGKVRALDMPRTVEGAPHQTPTAG